MFVLWRFARRILLGNQLSEHQPRKPASTWLTLLAVSFLFDADCDFLVDRLVADRNMDWHVVVAPSYVCF
jgi:hypothetical protein